MSSTNVKIVVTVPESDADKLRQAIGDAGGGQLGNYSHCSFSSKGTGRFLPTADAKPAIGNVGLPETVAEERIEITCARTHLTAVIAAIRANHPYEEIALDIYPLEDHPI
jgi:hypothetical protein